MISVIFSHWWREGRCHFRERLIGQESVVQDESSIMLFCFAGRNRLRIKSTYLLEVFVKVQQNIILNMHGLKPTKLPLCFSKL